MLTDEELLEVKGGGFTATLLNSVSRFIDTILNLGKTIGSAIRRVGSKSICKLS